MPASDNVMAALKILSSLSPSEICSFTVNVYPNAPRLGPKKANGSSMISSPLSFLKSEGISIGMLTVNVYIPLISSSM